MTTNGRTRRRYVVLALTLSSALWVSACGDDTSASDTARDAASEVDSAVDAGIARGQAEIFRQRVKDLVRQGESLDSMSVLEEAARDLPRSPTISGLGDTNGDGRDDDGKLQIAVDDSFACVAVIGADIDVTGARC